MNNKLLAEKKRLFYYKAQPESVRGNSLRFLHPLEMLRIGPLNVKKT